jgi:hypothetical protein
MSKILNSMYVTIQSLIKGLLKPDKRYESDESKGKVAGGRCREALAALWMRFCW